LPKAGAIAFHQVMPALPGTLFNRQQDATGKSNAFMTEQPAPFEAARCYVDALHFGSLADAFGTRSLFYVTVSRHARALA